MTDDSHTGAAAQYGAGPEDYAGFLGDGLEFPAVPLPGDIPVLGPDEEILVTVSLKLPAGTVERVKAEADKRAGGAGRGKYTVLMREWVEQALADLEQDRMVSYADVKRALAQLAHVA